MIQIILFQKVNHSGKNNYIIKDQKNPLFKTINKNVYPFWGWNFPDSEDEIYKNSDFLSKSFNNHRFSKNNKCDEEKKFKRNINNNDNIYNN